MALVAESARLAAQDRPGLVLAFDEVQEGPGGDLAVVNALAQELVATPLVVLGAGLPQTPERLMQAGSHAERFTYLTLDPLSPPEATAALLVPAAARQVGWDRDAAEHVCWLPRTGRRFCCSCTGTRRGGPPTRNLAAGSGTPRLWPEWTWPCGSCTTACSGAGGTGPARVGAALHGRDGSTP